MIYKSATTINQTVPVKPADTDSVSILAEVSAHLESPHQSAVFSELPLLLCTRTRELIRQENSRALVMKAREIK